MLCVVEFCAKTSTSHTSRVYVLCAEFASPEFDEFLDLIGRRVQLKGFDQYRGGLDVKSKCGDVSVC